jgi:uncharacterized membrane protein YedE/YeeE
VPRWLHLVIGRSSTRCCLSPQDKLNAVIVAKTLLFGAFLAARRVGALRWQVPNAPRALRMLTAGAVMGVSATVAGGCNIGHGFSGVPTLALSSLTATLFTFLGAWFGSYIRFLRPQRIKLYGIGMR